MPYCSLNEIFDRSKAWSFEFALFLFLPMVYIIKNSLKTIEIVLKMLSGYNTNISYKGTTYHIQTEDNGIKNPVVVTLLYSQGAILASKKTGYEHILEKSDYKEKVGKLMKDQHKSMIKELLSGKYTRAEKPEDTEKAGAH